MRADIAASFLRDDPAEKGEGPQEITRPGLALGGVHTAATCGCCCARKRHKTTPQRESVQAAGHVSTALKTSPFRNNRSNLPSAKPRSVPPACREAASHGLGETPLAHVRALVTQHLWRQYSAQPQTHSDNAQPARNSPDGWSRTVAYQTCLYLLTGHLQKGIPRECGAGDSS